MQRKLSLLSTSLLLAIGLAGCGPSTSATSPAAEAAAPAASPAPAATPTAAGSSTGQAPAGASAQPSLVVMVGGEPELDPCSTAAIQGEGKVPVLSGPDSEQPVLAELVVDQVVHVCDPGEAHWYVGIIWSEDAEVDCGLSSPIAVRAPYNGRCRSGWVSLAALKQLAG